jgi:hypothetical protein
MAAAGEVVTVAAGSAGAAAGAAEGAAGAGDALAQAQELKEARDSEQAGKMKEARDRGFNRALDAFMVDVSEILQHTPEIGALRTKHEALQTLCASSDPNVAGLPRKTFYGQFLPHSGHVRAGDIAYVTAHLDDIQLVRDIGLAKYFSMRKFPSKSRIALMQHLVLMWRWADDLMINPEVQGSGVVGSGAEPMSMGNITGVMTHPAVQDAMTDMFTEGEFDVGKILGATKEAFGENGGDTSGLDNPEVAAMLQGLVGMIQGKADAAEQSASQQRQQLPPVDDLD